MGNPICWFEIGTNDIESSKKFYDHIFEWEMKDDPNFPKMHMVNTETEPQGAIFKGPPEMPIALNVYFLVDNIEETLEKVKNAGGTVIMPRTEVPNAGSFAVFKDPEGVVASVFESLNKE